MVSKLTPNQIRLKPSRYPQSCRKCPFKQSGRLTCTDGMENGDLFKCIQLSLGQSLPFCVNHKVSLYENIKK